MSHCALVFSLVVGCASTVAVTDAGGSDAGDHDAGAITDVGVDVGVAPGCECPRGRCAVGESWPSPDGCNACACRENGLAGCSLRACEVPDAGSPVDVPPAERSCGSNRDCLMGEVCEYAEGCASTRGRCASDDCHSLPVAPQYCGCDGRTIQQVSACLPDRPWRSEGACPAASDAGAR